jgi:predicted glycosyltransferase involved in capsule biosynthesis
MINNATFIIPFRKDCEERLRNLVHVTDFIFKNICSNIIVCEHDKESQNKDTVEQIGARYIFEPMEDCFHRTKILNLMTKMAETDIIVNQDVDVLTFPFGYNQAVKKIGDNEDCMFCFPYDGRFQNVDIFDEAAIKNGDFNSLFYTCAISDSVGGCFVFDRTRYEKIGLENEEFRGWGFEDNERVLRAKQNGYQIERISGPLWHFNHPETSTSGPKHKDVQNNYKMLESLRRK